MQSSSAIVAMPSLKDKAFEALIRNGARSIHRNLSISSINYSAGQSLVISVRLEDFGAVDQKPKDPKMMIENLAFIATKAAFLMNEDSGHLFRIARRHSTAYRKFAADVAVKIRADAKKDDGRVNLQFLVTQELNGKDERVLYGTGILVAKEVEPTPQPTSSSTAQKRGCDINTVPAPAKRPSLPVETAMSRLLIQAPTSAPALQPRRAVFNGPAPFRPMRPRSPPKPAVELSTTMQQYEQFIVPIFSQEFMLLNVQCRYPHKARQLHNLMEDYGEKAVNIEHTPMFLKSDAPIYIFYFDVEGEPKEKLRTIAKANERTWTWHFNKDRMLNCHTFIWPAAQPIHEILRLILVGTRIRRDDVRG